MQSIKSILVSLLNRIFPPKPKPQIQIIRRSSSTLTLSQWRGDKETVKLGQKLLGNPDFKIMLDVLYNEHPAKIMLLGRVAIEERAILQARTEGYQMLLTNIELMGTLEVDKEPLEETFADPEKEKE